MVRKYEWYLLSALLVISLAFTMNWALKGAIHYQKDVIVPDLAGKSLIEALDILTQQNLGLKKEGAEYNDSVPAGTILRQSPASGAMVREGKIIRITISQGGETVFVPILVGQSLRSAEIALRTSFLSLGEISTRFSVQFEKDIVLAQDPVAKAIVPKNSLVHVVLSEGPPADGTLMMPDFTGKTLPDVEAWARQNQFKVESIPDPASPGEAGSVVHQEVAPDTVLIPQQRLRFTVATGTGKELPIPEPKAKTFHFEVPQGESDKEFSFVLVDSFGSREIWRSSLSPGSKHDVPLPEKMGPSPRIRIFIKGTLTEERSLR